MDDNQVNEMGFRIAELRRSHQMTQEQLAELLNVSTKHISHVERGTAKLSLNALVTVSKIFNCSLDYIIMGNKNDPILSRLPKTILDIILSDNDEDISRLMRYLEIYSELYNS